MHHWASIGLTRLLSGCVTGPNAPDHRGELYHFLGTGQGPSPELPKNVSLWRTEDACVWARHVLGYAFVSETFERYRVDGITLLRMTENDIAKEFADRNQLERQKIIAHILRMQQLYPCRLNPSGLSDFFDFYYRSRCELWPIYLNSLIAPRYTLLWRAASFESLMNKKQLSSMDNNTESKGSTKGSICGWLVFHSASILFPYLVFIFFALTWARKNYFLFAVYALSQMMLQGTEITFLWHRSYKTLADVLYTSAAFAFPLALAFGVGILGKILPVPAQDFLLFSVILIQAVQVSAPVFTALRSYIHKAQSSS